MGIKEMLGLSDEELVKPLPEPTPWSRPFWEGAKAHRLLLRRCASCGNIDHPPYPSCTNCSSEEHEWIEAAGTGTLYAYAINSFAVPFPFWDDMPYVLAMIDLPEGVRMISNIIDCDPKDLKNGMALEVVFEDVSDEIALPKFRPMP